MGLFSGGNSSSNTSAPNTGSQSQVGDPLAINVSAGDDQNATVNVQRNLTLEQTDFGAVESAFNLGDNALLFANELDERRSRDFGAALDFGRSSLIETTRAIDITNRQAFDTVEGVTSRALSLVGDNSRDAFSLSRDFGELSRDASSEVISFAQRSQQATEGLAANVLDFVQRDREPLVQGVVTVVKQVAIAVVVAIVAKQLIGSK